MMVELTYHINPNLVTQSSTALSKEDKIDKNLCYLMVQNTSQNVSLSSSDAGGMLSKRDYSSSFDYISFYFITQNDNSVTLIKTEGLLWKWEVGLSFDNAPFHFATQDEREFIL
jgi:hypothetical protein